MKNVLKYTLASLCIVVLSATTMLNDRIVETAECQLKEGKTIEDVHAANSRWVEFMNANVEGGDIRSYVLTSRVGDATPGKFTYVDSFPSLESWAASYKTHEMDAYKPIREGLQAAAECSQNALFESKQS